MTDTRAPSTVERLAEIQARREKARAHVHQWDDGYVTLCGWGIVHCRTCPAVEIY